MGRRGAEYRLRRSAARIEVIDEANLRRARVDWDPAFPSVVQQFAELERFVDGLPERGRHSSWWQSSVPGLSPDISGVMESFRGAHGTYRAARGRLLSDLVCMTYLCRHIMAARGLHRARDVVLSLNNGNLASALPLCRALFEESIESLFLFARITSFLRHYREILDERDDPLMYAIEEQAESAEFGESLTGPQELDPWERAMRQFLFASRASDQPSEREYRIRRVNVMTHIAKVGSYMEGREEHLKQIYGALSEFSHPSMRSNELIAPLDVEAHRISVDVRIGPDRRPLPVEGEAARSALAVALLAGGYSCWAIMRAYQLVTDHGAELDRALAACISALPEADNRLVDEGLRRARLEPCTSSDHAATSWAWLAPGGGAHGREPTA